MVLTAPSLTALGIDKVVSAGATAGNRAEIWYRGRNRAVNGRGINLVAVDRAGRITSVCFDTFLHEWSGYAMFRADPVTR